MKFRLTVGDHIIIRPGERIPLDGTVMEGSSACDESSITGESMPVSKRLGDSIFAGTINQTGSIEVKVTRLAQDSTIAKLIRLVEEAQSEKAETQRFLDRAERYYAAGVILFTLLLIIVPIVVFAEPFDKAFYRAMTAMVVASPCALVISTPASILSAIANGARRGVLFKGGAYLEKAADINVVAFDKTGTLTENRMFVRDLDSPETKRALLAMTLANDAEESSGAGDPLELALLDYAQKHGLEPARLKNDFPRQSSRPFDSLDKFMRVTVRENGGLASYLKGAPEVVLQRSRLTVAVAAPVIMLVAPGPIEVVHTSVCSRFLCLA